MYGAELSEPLAAVIAACLALAGVLVTVWMNTRQTRKLRNENTSQHAEGRALLHALTSTVESRFDSLDDNVSHLTSQVDGVHTKVHEMDLWRVAHEMQHELDVLEHARDIPSQ